MNAGIVGVVKNQIELSVSPISDKEKKKEKKNVVPKYKARYYYLWSNLHLLKNKNKMKKKNV